jgi:hypothetical protein
MQLNWKRLGQIVLLLGIILIGDSAFAATYYVDYSSGNDSNKGTSKSTAWQRAPGMTGCTALCSSTTINPGDSVILKGSVTWPNASMPWVWNFAGSSGNNIYVGVDQTWYSGSSWTRPILNGGGSQIGSTATSNIFLNIYGAYTTIDNFEFTGGYWLSSASYGSNTYINTQGTAYLDIKNCYFHGWSNQSSTVDSGTAVDQNTNGNPGTVIEQNVVDGSDTAAVMADPSCTAACLGSLAAFWYGPIYRNNVVNQTANGFVGDAQEFSGNLIENIRVSIGGNHENGFENNSDPCSTGLLFFNNVLRHTTAVNIWIAPQAGCVPSYGFNNVTYNTPAGNVMDWAYSLDTAGTGGKFYMFNNTVECGPNGNASQVCAGCYPTSGVCVFENNYLITSASPAINACNSNCTIFTDLVQTQAVANNNGYTTAETFGFSPTSGSSPTVGAGTNASSLCSAIGAVLASAGTACQNGTSYAVAYNSTTHTVSIPGSTPTARPSSGAWDIGAYQFGGAGPNTSQPQPPTGLTATVN